MINEDNERESNGWVSIWLSRPQNTWFTLAWWNLNSIGFELNFLIKEFLKDLRYRCLGLALVICLKIWTKGLLGINTNDSQSGKKEPASLHMVQVLPATATSGPLSLQARKNLLKVAVVVEAEVVTAWNYCQSWKRSPDVSHVQVGIKHL